MKGLTWRSWLFVIVSVVTVGVAPAVRAEDERPLTQSELEQRLKVLERKYEIDKEAADAKAKETPVVFASGKDGYGFKSPDGSFQLKFRGVIQADSRFFVDDQRQAPDQFLLRRIRPTLEGTAFKIFDFRITPDFANNSATSLYDAYIDIRPWDFAKLRFGKFKPPVGLERLQSASDTLFVERAFPTSLVPNRDTGLQLFGDLFNARLSYAISFTNGVGDGSTGETDTNKGKEGAARIFAHPFKDGDLEIVKGLGVGIAGSYAGTNLVAPTIRTPAQLGISVIPNVNNLLNYVGATPNGQRVRISSQGYWYYRSIGLLGEYVRSSQDVQRTATGAISRLTNEAWQVAGSWVLTGEDASFKGVKPRANFDIEQKTWGAWELVARYHVLRIDPDSFTNLVASRTTSIVNAKAYGVGLNWYLNRNVKVYADYEQTTFDGGGLLADRPNEKVVFTRVQFSY